MLMVQATCNVNQQNIISIDKMSHCIGTGTLWIITFIVILSLLAQRWVYSPLFFASKSFRATATSLVDELNEQRYFKIYFIKQQNYYFYQQIELYCFDQQT